MTIVADKSKPELSNFFQQTRDVTAKECGVSLACVKKVCSKAKKELEVRPSNKIAFKSPRKSYKRVKVMSSPDDFDNEVVRRTIHGFYDKGEFLTTAKILVVMQEKINYPGSKTSVKRILHNLNFKYKKCNDGRRFLMERNDIVVCRNHTQGYIWQNPVNTEGLKVPIGKGARLIVCHTGSPSFGFVNNSKLVFRCKSGSTEDYHLQMNADIFEKCFVEMLANLEESSVVVMDNAFYHSMLAEDYPRA
ncbi:DDE 3 domain-containing protein, partial [Aphis craccivora]